MKNGSIFLPPDSGHLREWEGIQGSQATGIMGKGVKSRKLTCKFLPLGLAISFRSQVTSHTYI